MLSRGNSGSHYKACLFILAIILLTTSLAGCKPRTGGMTDSSEANSDEPQSLSQEESEDQEEQLAQDSFHPFDWLRWNNRGGKLEVFDGYTLYQIDLNNDRTEVVTLQDSNEGALFGKEGATRFVWSDDRIFATKKGKWEIENGSAIYEANGKFHIVNASIWDRNGNLIKKFPTGDAERYSDDDGMTYYQLSAEDGATVDDICGDLQACFWLDQDHLAIQDFLALKLFIYSIPDDSITVVDDMSSFYEEFGKFAVYYGIVRQPYVERYVTSEQNIATCDGEYYYFCYRDREKANAAGTIHAADASGVENLFPGQSFDGCLFSDRIMVPYRLGNRPQCEIFYASTIERELKSLGTYNVSMPIQLEQNRISFTERDQQEACVAFCYEIDTGKWTSVPVPANCSFTGTVSIGEDIYFLLQENEAKSLLIDAQSQKMQEISHKNTDLFLSPVDGSSYYEVKKSTSDPRKKSIRISRFFSE